MEICQFTLPLTCRYLLDVPAVLPPDPPLVLTLHGYGSSPETMLRLTAPAVGPGVVVAALQGPNLQYGGDGPASGLAGYNWGIRQHSAECIQMHHAMVLRTLSELQTRFAAGAERCFLMGFSQACGFNYRFLGTHPQAVGGVIAICGGVPKDWEEPKYQDFDTPILHIARSEDEVFPTAIANRFADRLRTHAREVEFHLLPGQHRFPSKAHGLIRPWVARVLGNQASAGAARLTSSL
jgi:predicted esterase